MADSWEPTHVANHRMVHREGVPQLHEIKGVCCSGSTGAAPPVRLVRLWPDFNITCSVVTHNLRLQTRQWHPFLVLVVGLPLKLHSSQGLFFPKTAILMLRERFLIAKNTCEKIFPRFARTDQHFAPLSTRTAPPSTAFRSALR